MAYHLQRRHKALVTEVKPRVHDSQKNTSDETLVAQVCNGDRLAFSGLVDRHGLRFRAIALRTCGDLTMAEEMVQEAFIKLWTRPDRFDAGKAKFTTWFHRVVVNRCLDELRRRKPEALPDGFDEVDHRPVADAVLETEGDNAIMMAALSRLPERQRRALTLSYLDGYSNQEAAEIMELNVKALESLLVRARTKMREELKAHKADLLAGLV